MAKPHTTRDNESLQGVGTATKTYCRAALSTDPPVSGRSVGQLVVFPLDPTVRRAGGLVRQRYLRIELESSAVYHLSAPYRYTYKPDGETLSSRFTRYPESSVPIAT